jgi:hypothetical protein
MPPKKAMTDESKQKWKAIMADYQVAVKTYTTMGALHTLAQHWVENELIIERAANEEADKNGTKMTAQTMSRYPQQYNQANMKPRRKRFADGSAVVTYPDGSRLILESALAKSAVLCEGGPVSYSQSPRRAAIGKTRSGYVSSQLPAVKSRRRGKLVPLKQRRRIPARKVARRDRMRHAVA